MRLLVAIESCERDRLAGCHTAIRNTWGKDLAEKADLRFFVGSGGSVLEDDEIGLDAPDDYDGLPLKTIALMRWVIARDYDYVFKCDTDTFVRVDRLFAVKYQEYDYVGRFGTRYTGARLSTFYDIRLGKMGRDTVWPWASGGVGYFLSKRAIAIVAGMTPIHWAEDFCVGQTLGPLVAKQELRSLNPEPYDGYVAWHYCTTGKNRAYDPNWQYSAHANGRATGR